MLYLRGALGIACLFPLSAGAQQTEWAKLPRMQLERQFAGPCRTRSSNVGVIRWMERSATSICRPARLIPRRQPAAMCNTDLTRSAR